MIFVKVYAMTSPTRVKTDLQRSDEQDDALPPEREPPRWRVLAVGATTPDRLTRIGTVLVVACVVTAVLSFLAGSARANAVGERGARLAALNTDTALLYRSLQEAHALATGGMIAGGVEQAVLRARYYDYIRQASQHLVSAAGLLPDGREDAAIEIMGQLPRHIDLVEAARTFYDRDRPLAQSYSGRASMLMESMILPAADELRRTQAAALRTNYREVGAFPVAVLVIGVAALLVLGYVTIRERQRTNRTFSLGLVAAGVTLTSTVVWWIVAATSAGDRVAAAFEQNATVTALENVPVLQASAELTALTLDLQRAGAPLTGIAAGPAVLALLAAGGVAIGIGRRVQEYR